MAKQVEINTMAPDFTLPDFSGNQITLSDYRERLRVVLVFNRGFA
jgi:peroxiredoxin